MENLYYNNKSFLLENNQLYEDLSIDNNFLYEDDNEKTPKAEENNNIDKTINIIEKNKDNKDFMNGLISIINGEQNNTDEKDQNDHIVDTSSIVNGLNNIENVINQFEIKL